MSRFSIHVQGLILATLGALVITPDGLLVRLAETHEWTIVFWRGLFIGTFLLLIQIIRQPHRKALIPQTKKEGFAIIFAMLGSISFVMSVLYTSVANALVILSTMSLFAALLSMIFLKERIATHTWIAMGAAFIGIVIVFFEGLQGEGLIGMLIAVACAFTTATNMTIFRSAPKINVPTIVTWGGFLTAGVAYFFAETIAISLQDFIILAAMGIISALAFVLIGNGAKRIPAPEVALLMLLETILGPIWVWAILAEVPSHYAFIGGGIVITTLAIHAVVSLKKAPTV